MTTFHRFVLARFLFSTRHITNIQESKTHRKPMDSKKGGDAMGEDSKNILNVDF